MSDVAQALTMGATVALVVTLAAVWVIIRQQRAMRELLADHRRRSTALEEWDKDWTAMLTAVLTEVSEMGAVVSDRELSDAHVREDVLERLVRVAAALGEIRDDEGRRVLGPPQQRETLMQMLMERTERDRSLAPPPERRGWARREEDRGGGVTRPPMPEA